MYIIVTRRPALTADEAVDAAPARRQANGAFVRRMKNPTCATGYTTVCPLVSPLGKYEVSRIEMTYVLSNLALDP
jgi:hypothetical protein